MKTLHKFLSAAAAVIALAPVCSFAQLGTTTYNGNASTGFGGPIGQGALTFSTDGTTLFGTVTPGGTSGFNDTLVIYIDSQAGGFNTTSGFTDTGGGNDNLRKSISGYNGTTRSTVNFAPGFGADYAIALGPTAASFGALFTLANNGSFNYGTDGTNGNANLTPTGTNGLIKDGNGNVTGNQTFTFSIPLALLGGATSFNFETTYLDGNGTYRSNEALGNTITDTDNPLNTGNIGQDTSLTGTFNTFVIVPEPSTWLAGGLLVLVGGLTMARSRRSVA